jgi:hypothetical protein
MPEVKGVGLTPVRTRTIAIFSGKASAFSDLLQPALENTEAAYQEASGLAAFLLQPLSVLAMTLGLWRLTSDLDWTSSFPIASGLFSHWIVWIALAIGLHVSASLIEPGVRSAQAPNHSQDSISEGSHNSLSRASHN